MKYPIATCGMIALMTATTFAADLRPQDISARPIENVPVTKEDRAFLTATAADLLLQKMAINTVLESLEPSISKEEASFTLRTLQEIQDDLQGLANDRKIALPLEGSIAKPRDFERLMNSRNGSFEREYARYAQRSTRKLLERFETASRNADDPQVRAFALRHVRWVEATHREAKGLPPAVIVSTETLVRTTTASEQAAKISAPPRSVPLAAAGSPVSPGASR